MEDVVIRAAYLLTVFGLVAVLNEWKHEIKEDGKHKKEREEEAKSFWLFGPCICQSHRRKPRWHVVLPNSGTCTKWRNFSTKYPVCGTGHVYFFCSKVKNQSLHVCLKWPLKKLQLALPYDPHRTGNRQWQNQKETWEILRKKMEKTQLAKNTNSHTDLTLKAVMQITWKYTDRVMIHCHNNTGTGLLDSLSFKACWPSKLRWRTEWTLHLCFVVC